jgi:glycosyltransferase involved in cell wall biosynthesis
MLPPDFHLKVGARLEGRTLLGGEPYAIVHLGDRAAAQIRAWSEGAPVGDGGELARALVRANLAQPTPPSRPSPPVSVVIPVRDRSVSRLLAALDVAEVIVVDDASADGESLRREASAAGAKYVRRDVRGGAGAARNTGLALAAHELVACVDSDCLPLPGWLEALLPHFADPELSAIAPRIVALRDESRVSRVEHEKLDSRRAGEARAGEARGGATRGGGLAAALRRRAERALRAYEAGHSPLDRGPAPARVVPYGRVPFVPGAAIVVRRHLRFDETLNGGEDVEFVWRVPYVRYEPAGSVAHDHRTDPAKWFKRRVYYGRTAAGIAKHHPGKARPLNVSPWTTAAWVALAARKPVPALAIVGVATALTSRQLQGAVPDPTRTAIDLAARGSWRSGRVVADALTRAWWPLATTAALTLPPTRAPLAAAMATKSPLQLADDLAYGIGLWQGCFRQRTLDPLLPAKAWTLDHSTL